MCHPVRNEKSLAGLERYWLPTLELILQQAFKYISDLFTRMRVLDGNCARSDIDARLDDFVSWHADIVLQKIGALNCLLLQYGTLLVRHR